MPSNAGKKVRPNTTELSTTSEPAMPMDEIADEEKNSRPSRPMATAMPEKVTALPAVATATCDGLADFPALAQLFAEAADQE